MERASHAIAAGGGAAVRERAIGAEGKVALCRVFPCHCRVGPVVEDYFARTGEHVNVLTARSMKQSVNPQYKPISILYIIIS